MAKKNPEKPTVHMEDGRFWDQFKIKFKMYMENPERSFSPPPRVSGKKKREDPHLHLLLAVSDPGSTVPAPHLLRTCSCGPCCLHPSFQPSVKKNCTPEDQNHQTSVIIILASTNGL